MFMLPLWFARHISCTLPLHDVMHILTGGGRKKTAPLTGCRYFLPNPDVGIALLTSAAKGLTPRSFPSVLLEVLLGPFMPIISAVVGGDFDRISRRGAEQRFASLRQ
jgi:hypothetical protein